MLVPKKLLSLAAILIIISFKVQMNNVITINGLNNETITEKILEFRDVEVLIIQKSDSSRWQSRPPLSYYQSIIFQPPFWTLPQEIGQLTSLEKLTLTGLDLNELPEEIGSLKKLRLLDLSFNKLNLHQELTLLGKLPNLQTLIFYGNHYDEASLFDLKSLNPKLKVIVDLD